MPRDIPDVSTSSCDSATQGGGSFARAWFRLPVEVPVQFQLGGSGWFRGTTANLSCGGLLLCTRTIPAPGLHGIIQEQTPIHLRLLLPGEWLELEARGIWGSPPEAGSPWYRLGMAFQGMSGGQDVTLSRFLTERMMRPELVDGPIS